MNGSGSEDEEEDNLPITCEDISHPHITKETNVMSTSENKNECEKTAHYFVFSGDNKAGMHGYEKKKQAQIIYEMSKNSSFFKQAEKQDGKRKDKIGETKKKVEDYIASKRKNLLATVSGGISAKTGVMKMVDSYVSEFEALRDLSTIKVVVDMDMFYAAVAIRDRPHLKDKPVAIGGTSMISTSNYVARKFGVRSAMPGFIAKKLCPQLIFVEHEVSKYKAASDIVKNIMLEYDPNLVSYSLDEFFMDLTAYTDSEIARRQREQYGDSVSNDIPCDGVEGGKRIVVDTAHKNIENCEVEEDDIVSPASTHKQDDVVFPYRSSYSTNYRQVSVSDTSTRVVVSSEYRRQVACEIVEEFRNRVLVATGGLTCSAGIANNSYLAKIGADQNKPNGQFSLPPSRESVLEFLETLPCRKIPGIGRVTENILSELGLKTMGDIKKQRDIVLVAFTPKLGRFLVRASLGIDSSEGRADGDKGDDGDGEGDNEDLQKSIGTERTFRPMNEVSMLMDKLHHICTRVHEDLAKHKIYGGNLTLKIKTSAFQLYTRSCAVSHLSPGIFHIDDIFKVARKLFLAFLSSHAESLSSEQVSSKREGGDDDTDAIQSLAGGKDSYHSQLPFSRTLHSPKSSAINISHSGVSIRLMGVQISKLGRFKQDGDGKGGSVRDTKIGKMLLAAAPPTRVDTRRHTAALSSDQDILSTSALNTHVESTKYADRYNRSSGKKDPRKSRIQASVLDMMYCQQSSVNCHRLQAEESSVIRNKESSVESGRCEDRSSTCGTFNRKRKHEGGVSSSSFCDEDVSMDAEMEEFIETSSPPTSTRTGACKSSPNVENLNGMADFSCPICSHKCKSLFQLNIHLDRNCETTSDSNRIVPRTNTNNIEKYFGFRPSS